MWIHEKLTLQYKSPLKQLLLWTESVLLVHLIVVAVLDPIPAVTERKGGVHPGKVTIVLHYRVIILYVNGDWDIKLHA